MLHFLQVTHTTPSSPSGKPNKIQAFVQLRKHFVFSRIFVEDEGVTGNGLFASQPTTDHLKLHVLGNALRVLLMLGFTPIYLINTYYTIRKPVSLTPPTPAWDTEFAQTTPAFLATVFTSSAFIALPC
jgi:hypothetical protein